MSEFEIVQPAGWKKPRGYSNGVLAPGGARLCFVAGQIAWDERQELVGGSDLAAQFRQALANVARVLREAGGVPQHVVRMTIYVTDKHAYLAASREIGGAWREHFGAWYPAMSLVQVAALLEDGALVEIEATAAIPDRN